MTAQGQQRGPGEAVDQVAAEAGQAAAEAQDRPRAEMGDPSSDPVLTVRIEPGRHWRDREARRAVKASNEDQSPWPWVQVTGPMPVSAWFTDAELRAWPITHPIEYAATFRHASLADGQERAPLAGDDLAGPDANLFR